MVRNAYMYELQRKAKGLPKVPIISHLGVRIGLSV